MQVQFVLPKSPVRYIILSGGGGEGKWEREAGNMVLIYVPRMEGNNRYGEGSSPPDSHELKEGSQTMRASPVP